MTWFLKVLFQNLKLLHIKMLHLALLFHSITSVVDSLQQWPWAPCQRILYSQSLLLSGGRKISMAFLSVYRSGLLFLGKLCKYLSGSLCYKEKKMSPTGWNVLMKALGSPYTCLCTQDSFPYWDEQSRQRSRKCSYWLTAQLWDCEGELANL